MNTFDDLMQQLFPMYFNQQYQLALDTIAREGGRFPEQRARMLYWRLCLHNLLGETEAALQCFEEVLALGTWFSPSQLRADPDLKTLQGNPDFERMVELCIEQRDKLQANTKPLLLTFEPQSNHNPPYPLLLALPQSSQVGGPDEQYIWNDHEWSAREIGMHLEQLQAKYEIDVARIVIAGFSMGGRLAAWLPLSGKIAARGFIGVGAAVGDAPEGWTSVVSQGYSGRAYLIVGDKDAPFSEKTPIFADLLRAHNIACELKIYPDMGHVFPPDFAQTLSAALRYITQ